MGAGIFVCSGILRRYEKRWVAIVAQAGSFVDAKTPA
jgi:hypothetical protein